MTVTWHVRKYKVHKFHKSCTLKYKVHKLRHRYIFLKVYLWWSLWTLYLHACQVRGTVGDLGLCGCVCVTSFECWLPSLCVDSAGISVWASFCFIFFMFLGHYRCKSPARIHFTQNSKVSISGHMCYEAGRVSRPLNVSCWGFRSSCSFFKVVNVWHTVLPCLSHCFSVMVD